EVTAEPCNPTIDPSVTQQSESVTQLFSSVTQQKEVCNREKPPISPLTVLPSFIDRPTKPSNQPSLGPEDSAGGMDGYSASLENLPGKLETWLSDCLELRSGQRVFPTKEHKRILYAKANLGSSGHVALAFYKFLQRPMGTSGLNDPFGFFVRELDTRIEDVERELSIDPMNVLLDDYHKEVFPYAAPEDTRLFL